jgi:hypothetical protein
MYDDTLKVANPERLTTHRSPANSTASARTRMLRIMPDLRAVPTARPGALWTICCVNA